MGKKSGIGRVSVCTRYEAAYSDDVRSDELGNNAVAATTRFPIEFLSRFPFRVIDHAESWFRNFNWMAGRVFSPVFTAGNPKTAECIQADCKYINSLARLRFRLPSRNKFSRPRDEIHPRSR